MPIDEYVTSPLVSTANSFIAERYLKLRDANVPADQMHNGLEPLPHIQHGLAQPVPHPAPPHDHDDSELPQYQNHVENSDFGLDNVNGIVNHHQPHQFEPPPPPPPPPPPVADEHFGFAIIETPVPSYDGVHMNMCYSVDRIDLNQI